MHETYVMQERNDQLIVKCLCDFERSKFLTRIYGLHLKRPNKIYDHFKADR